MKKKIFVLIVLLSFVILGIIVLVTRKSSAYEDDKYSKIHAMFDKVSYIDISMDGHFGANREIQFNDNVIIKEKKDVKKLVDVLYKGVNDQTIVAGVGKPVEYNATFYDENGSELFKCSSLLNGLSCPGFGVSVAHDELKNVVLELTPGYGHYICSLNDGIYEYIYRNGKIAYFDREESDVKINNTSERISFTKLGYSYDAEKMVDNSNYVVNEYFDFSLISDEDALKYLGMAKEKFVSQTTEELFDDMKNRGGHCNWD